MTRSRRRSLATIALAWGMLACGGPSEPSQEPVLVFAAASLTEAFESLADAFETAHPQLSVELNLGGSSSLAQQILEGAPADVFASADTSNMDHVIEGGAAANSSILVRNSLQIAVPAGNPGGVSGLSDFGREDLLIGLCAEGVPCGNFARQALASAGVAAAVDTNEPDVRALLLKIEAGELDAGIVYSTDVLAAGDQVEGIEIPNDVNVSATYQIAALSGAPNRPGADAFVSFALSEEARGILAGHGFTLP